MRSAIVFVALLAFLGLAAAATPSTPTWPKAFSASVLVQNVSDPRSTYFWRWFHDLGLNKARLDGFVSFDPNIPPVFTKILVDENQKEEFVIAYEIDQVSCYERAVTRPLITPDFSDFTYRGSSIINYITVNQWTAVNSTQNELFIYYEDAQTREPVRFRAFNSEGVEEQWTFYEFDAAAQDPNLFELEDPIASICNAVDNTFINKLHMQ